MRIAFVVSFLVLAAMPAFARSDPAGTIPASSNDAGWAEWEAQARITDGDYDGAVQAQQQADIDRQQANQQLARASKR
jgi:hypothetical protein